MFEPTPPPRLDTEAQQVKARAMSEGELLANVVDAAPKLGWRIIHFRDSRREVRTKDGGTALVGDTQASYWPDCAFVSTVPGRHTFFRELKGYNARGRLGTLSDGQRLLLGLMRDNGDDVDVWTPAWWVSGEITRRLT